MLHMIGNAHLDPVWLWRWQEGCAEAIGTCWAAIDRLEEDEGFIFTRGEALIYKWIEELDPKLFSRIRHFVTEGRWVVINGWWIQPDCNLPSGESFIRQALYGKRYFQERFGVDVTVGYNVDSFGHTATLPMLLRHTGADSYVFMRPMAHEMTLPGDLFDWVSADGSRVSAFRIPLGYHSSLRAGPLDTKIDRHAAMAASAGHPFMCFYGVGNHGGGPTREGLATINARITAGEELAFSDPVKFFAAVRDVKRPEVDTELQFHAIGCYSVAARLKQLHRRAEAALGEAEAAAALAWRHAGVEYPAAALHELWTKLLFNQFHDTLGGSSIESACDDSVHDYGAILSGTGEILNTAARRLAGTVRGVEDPRDLHMIAMNFSGVDFDGIVEIEPWTDFDATTPRRLLDEDGRDIAFQRVDPEGLTRGLQRIVARLAVPAFGRRVLRYAASAPMAEPDADPNPRPPRPAHASTEILETAGWRLVLDPASGAIKELRNRASGMNLFTGDAHRAILVEDATDTWSHGIDRFGFDGETMTCTRVTLLEQGTLRLAVEVETALGDSRIRTLVLLPEDPDLPVDLRVTIEWHDRHRLLRLAYPVGTDELEYEIAAGWIARPADGREVTGHRWVRAARPDSAVVIANDAKYSYAAQDGTLFITALRAPPYAHHDPVKLHADQDHRYLDQGEHRFTVRLHGAASLSPRDAAEIAQGMSSPPFIVPHVSRGGHDAWRGQWLRPETETSVVTALKRSEDGHGLVLRAVELQGKPDQLRIGEAAIPIAPRGIVTGRLERTDLRASDGLER